MIFYLDDLSIIESAYWSPLLLFYCGLFPPSDTLILLYIFKCSYLEYINGHNCCMLLINWYLYHYNWLSLCLNLLAILRLLREKLRVGIPSWLYGAVLRLGLMIWVSVFCTHFYLDILSFIWCVRIAQLVYWVSFRENCSVCSCKFGAAMRERELRSLLCLNVS